MQIKAGEKLIKDNFIGNREVVSRSKDARNKDRLESEPMSRLAAHRNDLVLIYRG